MAAKKVMLVDPTYLDTIMRRQAITADPKLSLQVNLDREMEQILQSRALSVYDKLKSYNAVLHRYLQLTGESSPNAAKATPAEQASTQTEQRLPVITEATNSPTQRGSQGQTEGEAINQSQHEQLLKRLPATHRVNARRLLNALKLTESAVAWDDSGGNVKVSDRPIRCANVISWLNYALKQRPASAPPAAIKQFAKLLSDSGLDVNLIPNARLRQEVKAIRRPVSSTSASSTGGSR